MSTAANVFERHWRLCTPVTGAAHEAYTLVGTEDISFEITIDTDYCLIFKLENTGDMTQAGDFQLQYNVGGAGFNDVNASSSNVRTATTGDADDATSTTERLTAVTETFTNSVLDDVDGLQARNMAGHEAAEYYYGINFRSAELSGGEEITFQLLSGGSDSNTHSQVPTVTVPVLAKTSNGTPSIASPTASGVSTIFKRASGTPALVAVAAAGVAILAGVLDANGTPEIDSPTASGSAKIIKTASGTPNIESPSASGVARIIKRASGTPSIASPIAAGAVNLAPRVWLNTSQTISGATSMTRTAWNVAGTSITFTDPAGPPIGSLFLGVENRNLGGGDSNTGWIVVTVDASRPASGTPSIESPIASGVATLGGLPASGAPAIDSPVASGIATIFKLASGTPDIDSPTAAGQVTQVYKPSGTPSIDSPIASGVATIFKRASGALTLEEITASGTASLAGILTASGTPAIESPTSTAVATIFKRGSGTPEIEVVTASGIVTLNPLPSSGSPSIDSPTASGTAILAPRVWLNTSQSLIGATEMSRTAYNVTGTSITFTDPIGGPFASLFLGVENRNNSEVGWIAVTVIGGKTAFGTPSIDAVTASGVAVRPGQQPAFGTPSIDAITASGLVNVFGGAEGLPTLVDITASGVALTALSATGTPAIEEVTASGVAGRTALLASGTPAIDSPTASGVATIFKRASGTLAIDSPVASGTAIQTHKLSGTPSIETITASGIARFAHDASGNPSIAVITASGVAVPSIQELETHTLKFTSASRSATFSAVQQQTIFSSDSRQSMISDTADPLGFILTEDGDIIAQENDLPIARE